jgi:hypothetical protein
MEIADELVDKFKKKKAQADKGEICCDTWINKDGAVLCTSKVWNHLQHSQSME